MTVFLDLVCCSARVNLGKQCEFSCHSALNSGKAGIFLILNFTAGPFNLIDHPLGQYFYLPVSLTENRSWKMHLLQYNWPVKILHLVSSCLPPQKMSIALKSEEESLIHFPHSSNQLTQHSTAQQLPCTTDSYFTQFMSLSCFPDNNAKYHLLSVAPFTPLVFFYTGIFF